MTQASKIGHSGARSGDIFFPVVNPRGETMEVKGGRGEGDSRGWRERGGGRGGVVEVKLAEDVEEEEGAEGEGGEGGR